MDLIVNGAPENEVSLCLWLLEVTHLADPIKAMGYGDQSLVRVDENNL
jgi:hypothetical protein